MGGNNYAEKKDDKRLKKSGYEGVESP